VQPLVRPVERRVLRAGGSPHTAPWWALVAVVVGGIIFLSLLGFVRDQVVVAAMALQRGSAGIYYLVVTWASAVLQIALIVRVLSSWVGGTPFSPWWRWSFVLTEWIIAPLRRVVPTFGMIDITPIIAYVLLRLAQSLVLGII
jgi:YggT family protein